MTSHTETVRGKPRLQSQRNGHSGTVKIVFISIVSTVAVAALLGACQLFGGGPKLDPKPPVNTSSPLTPKPSPTIAPTSSIPASTPSPDVASSSTPEPTVMETTTSEPTVAPTDNGDIDIGIDRWKDSDPVDAKTVCVPYFTINGKPFKLFMYGALVNGPKGDPTDGFVCSYTEDELFYYEIVNGRIKLIPTEYMRKLIEERFPGGKFESQGYDLLEVYLVNEKGMSHDESETFASKIKTYKDLRIVNADPNIIPVEERFITPRKDLGLQAEIADKVMVLDRYREEHKILV